MNFKINIARIYHLRRNKMFYKHLKTKKQKMLL